jgi:hypothetical protein
VSEYLESWLEWRDQADRTAPDYVEDELRGYLECGILCFGFGRALCTGCGRGFVIAFSCKGRGVCRPAEPGAAAMGTLGVPIGCLAGRGHGWPALPMASPAGARATVGDLRAEAEALMLAIAGISH